VEEEFMRRHRALARPCALACYGGALGTVAVAACLLWSRWTRLHGEVAVPAATPLIAEMTDNPAPASASPDDVQTVVPPPTVERPHHVRGGITIVGRRGTASAVAPSSDSDLAASAGALRPTVSKSLAEAPSNGPRIYTSSRGAAPAGDYRKWDLRFYNYDANPTEVVRKLNRGLANNPAWAPRVVSSSSH
jgi:hypothetical protein